MREEPLPFRPRDWVFDGQRVAQVKRVYRDQGEVLFDLVLYSRHGERVGRESPVEGGPRSYEPCCSVGRWTRISEPRFPLTPKWVERDGRRVAELWAGDPLPPANWRPPQRRAARVALPSPDEFRAALEAIAAGHNDARGLAADVLSKSRRR